jgi:hypothetical protein
MCIHSRENEMNSFISGLIPTKSVLKIECQIEAFERTMKKKGIYWPGISGYKVLIIEISAFDYPKAPFR